jgi:cardiolipin synthase A/B
MQAQIPFVTTGSYPIRAGNTVQLLIDGEPAFRRVCQAIEAAQHSIWATIAFMWADFQMPDGHGTALEVLDRAARRGVDVRLLFWRPDDQTAIHRRNAFWGDAQHFALLEQKQPKVGIRWDCAQVGFCQHQKTWLIDADTDQSMAFLGGLNLNPNSVVAPGHHGEGQNHDLYIELTGTAVADVQHNFVQRWNEASQRHLEQGCWGERSQQNLEFPTQLPAKHGTALVQIQRTIHANRYSNGQAAVNGQRFDIASGEHTNFEQYCKSIQAASRSIYIENQCLEIPEIIQALDQALKRGVEVVVLLPITPDLSPEVFARVALGAYPNFTLAGMAGLDTDGYRKPVWVHSKLMLIDDTWATIGSANLHRWSMFGNSELNAAILSPETVKAFRIALLGEHLALNTSDLDDVRALQAFKKIADTNQEKFLKGNHTWQGLVIALDVSSYGIRHPKGWKI